MGRFNDMTGRRFGRLIVIKTCGKNKGQGYKWLCICDCGSETIVSYPDNLLTGRTRSCGCLQKEARRANTTNGEYAGGKATPELEAYKNMMGRCFNKRDTSYKNYGGRGISVCDRWGISFENFLFDMGRRPSQSHSIDRKDNSGDYTPKNCRWATPSQQARNTRQNRIITFGNKTQCLTDWAEGTGISAGTLWARLKIWPIEDALTRPLRGESCQ